MITNVLKSWTYLGLFGSMSERVLDRIFGIKDSPGFFDQLNYKSSQDVIIGQRPAIFISDSSKSEAKSNQHKFSLAGITPQIQTPGGTGALITAALLQYSEAWHCF